jgi:hypothetical protein
MIDGIDRLGKSSLIQRIQDEEGYHLVIHYDKPKALKHNINVAELLKNSSKSMLDNQFLYNHSDEDRDEMRRHIGMSGPELARVIYQQSTNFCMFELLKSPIPIIFDRTHLGEMVYSPLYRNYPGSYVFDLEKQFLAESSPKVGESVKLILLTTSNFDMLEDDGLSFDFAKKEDEQKMFIEAFNKSSLKNKVLVDVHNGNGGYKTYEEIFKEAMK